MNQNLSTRRSLAAYAAVLIFTMGVFLAGLHLGRTHPAGGSEREGGLRVDAREGATKAPNLNLDRELRTPKHPGPNLSAQKRPAGPARSSAAVSPPPEVVVTQDVAGQRKAGQPAVSPGSASQTSRPLSAQPSAAKPGTAVVNKPAASSVTSVPPPPASPTRKAAVQSATSGPTGDTGRSGEMYSVQIGAVATEAEAKQLLLRLEARGYTGILDRPVAGKDRFFRVRVGAYVDRTAAVRAADLLKDEGFAVYVKKMQSGDLSQ